MPQQKASRSFADDLAELEKDTFAADLAKLEAEQQKPEPKRIPLGSSMFGSTGGPSYNPADPYENARIAAKGAPGVLAAMATGGASIPVQMGAFGAAGAASELIGGGSLKDAATTGGLDAATAGLLGYSGKGLGALARGTMRSALRVSAPIARKAGGDAVADMALAERILPTEGGAAKAAMLRKATQAVKLGALNAAAPNVTMLPATIAAEAEQRVAPMAQQAYQSGIRRTPDTPNILRSVVARNAPGVTPAELDAFKHQWDDQIGNAIAAQKFQGKPTGVDQAALQALSKSAREGLDTAVPGYKALNRRIMTLEAVRQGAANRAAIPATGLDDAAMMYLAPSHPSALAVRAARAPVSRGAAAIGLNEMGDAAQNPLVRAAIIAILNGALSR